MIVTFLDYVDAVLRSRRPFRRPVRNIGCSPSTPIRRATVLENRYRDGSPFVWIGDSYAMHYPGELVLFRTISAISSPRPAVPKRQVGPAPCVAGRRLSGLRSGSSSGTPGIGRAGRS